MPLQPPSHVPKQPPSQLPLQPLSQLPSQSEARAGNAAATPSTANAGMTFPVAVSKERRLTLRFLSMRSPLFAGEALAASTVTLALGGQILGGALGDDKARWCKQDGKLLR